MPGTRSVYFDPHSEAIITNRQNETGHKFSRQVCLTIIENQKQRKHIASLMEEIQILKIRLLKEEKDDD